MESICCCSSRVSMPLTLKPFEVSQEDFLSFELTQFKGAAIHCDLQARGSRMAPNFLLRLRVASIQKQQLATALESLSVRAEIPSDAGRLTIAQIKECLRQRGEGQLMRGVTRKEDFVALLRSSDEHRCPPPEVLVAAGQRGLVVKDLYMNSRGEERICVKFDRRSTLDVFPTSGGPF
eukprot:s3370_g7.t1